MFKEQDSVATFRSKVHTAHTTTNLSTKTNSLAAPATSHTPRVTINLNPQPLDPAKDDAFASISKMSDTASRLSSFETHFQSVTEEISEALEKFQRKVEAQANAQASQNVMLSLIMEKLNIISPCPPNTTKGMNLGSSQSTATSTLANQSTTKFPAGVLEKDAGQGS